MKRYHVHLVRWDDRDNFEHMVFIGPWKDIPEGWAPTQWRPL